MTLHADGAVRQIGGAYEIRFERFIAKPVERVWAALTVPERLADWLAPAEVELRVGGRFVLKFPGHPPDEQQITELDPPRLLAWTWRHPDHPNSIVRWELTPAPGGCRLVLTQTELPASNLLSVAPGWQIHLQGLDGAVDGVRTPYNFADEKALAALYAEALPA